MSDKVKEWKKALLDKPTKEQVEEARELLSVIAEVTKLAFNFSCSMEPGLLVPHPKGGSMWAHLLDARSFEAVILRLDPPMLEDVIAGVIHQLVFDDHPSACSEEGSTYTYLHTVEGKLALYREVAKIVAYQKEKDGD